MESESTHFTKCIDCTVSEDPAQGAGVISAPQKKLKKKYPGLRGWMKCKGEKFLKSPQDILMKRKQMGIKLSKLRGWCTLFMLLMGRAPKAVDLMCGEGGMSHGLALAGFHVVAVDNTDRPFFTQHPNVKYVKADATKFDVTPFDIVFASPPCQKFSTMKHAAGAQVQSKELNLIPDVRNLCVKHRKPYCIENVIGAGDELRNPIGLCGTMFGLGVARHRLFECSFALDHTLECEHEGYCLGNRSRMPKLDKLGKRANCCPGNLWGVYGSPGIKTGGVKDWSEAMNAHHMSAKGLSLSLPYVYGQYMGALALLHLVKEKVREGTQLLSNHMQRQVMAADIWDVQVCLKNMSYGGRLDEGGTRLSPEATPFEPETLVEDMVKVGHVSAKFHSTTLGEYELKWDQLYYSKLGPVGCVMGKTLKQFERLPVCSDRDMQDGLFTTVWVMEGSDMCQSKIHQLEMEGALVEGSRMCVWLSNWKLNWDRKLWKLEVIEGWDGKWLTNHWVPSLPKLAVDAWPEAEEEVEVTEAEAKKRYMAKWQPVNLNVLQFKVMEFDEEIVSWLEEGVPILYLGDREKVELVTQYEFKDDKCEKACIVECERAISCGALVPPPEGIKVTKVHSWVVVMKGSRTRVCLDCSTLINDWVPSIPFNLPQFQDVAKLVKPGSFMAKFDLRDFFWNLKVREGDLGLMGVRHPGDGKVYVHERLCFGYKDSPRLACTLSEAVAQKLRLLGVSCLVFVDDFLICEDDYETCVHSMLVMEAVLLDLGFDISAHKTEGPLQVIIFLGVEIDARPEIMCFRLPAEKMVKIRSQLEQLKAWEEKSVTQVPAQDLASIVGMLCFAARVVNGGQMFLRSMWDSLSIAHIDRLGRPWVKWGSLPIPLSEEVYEEANIWRHIVKTRNSFPIHHKELIPVVINMATDSSMKGGGGVVSFNMAAEEVACQWTEFEKMQHINWLEMLMVWIMLYSFRGDLSGKKLFCEVDNMVTCWCLRRAGARSKSMMVLVRWIWMLSLQYDIQLDVHHLAGELNVRPDALSRGAKPLTPRIKLKSCWTEYLRSTLREWEFDLCVGREQEDFNLSEGASDEKLEGHTAFIHPRFDQIGECLWWIFEAVRHDPFNTRGVVVLPRKEDAMWWPLVKRLVVLRCLPAAVEPLVQLTSKHTWSPLSSKFDVCLCAFPVMPTGIAPTEVHDVATLVEGIPVDLNSSVSPSSDATRLYDGRDFKVGSFVFLLFGDEEMVSRYYETTTKTGRFKKEYGDLYEVMEMSEDWLRCKFWNKAKPSGAHDRLTTFLEDTWSVQVNGELWEVPVHSGRTLMDVTSLVDVSRKNVKRITDRKVMFDACGTVANMWDMDREAVDGHYVGAAYRVSLASVNEPQGDQTPLQERAWLSTSADFSNGDTSREAVTGEKQRTLSENNKDDAFTTPETRGRLAPAREVSYHASRGSLRLGNITQCWDGHCTSPFVKDITCSGCDKMAHSKCYGVKLFTMEDQSYATKCPECLCEEFADVVDTDGELSPQLIRDMVSWSLDSCGSNRKKSVQDVMSNMVSATKRYEKARPELKAGACLKKVPLFGAMLEYVAFTEGHPASVLKHLTGLKHWFDPAKNGGITRQEVDFSKDQVLLDKAATLVAALYRGKNPGDEIPWDIIQLSYRLMKYSKSNIRIKSRLEVIADLLLLAGYRVGETCKTDSAHGLHTGGFMVRCWENDKAFWCATGVEDDVLTLHAIDVTVDDYKMHNQMGLVSVTSPVESCDNTEGGWGLNLYRSVNRMCEAFDMKWHYPIINGNRVKMINYFVIRVDLFAFSIYTPTGMVIKDMMEACIKILPDMDDDRYFEFIIDWMTKRWESDTREIKFFNVAGGTLEEMDAVNEQFVMCMLKWMQELNEGGHGGRAKYDPKNSMSGKDWEYMIYNTVDQIVAVRNGPLLRATHGSYNTHMPLSYSTASNIVDFWKEAELEARGVSTLKIVTHSGRHTATARARTKILLTDCDPTFYDEVIDGHMRWQPDEGKLRKDYTGHLDLDVRLCPTMRM